MKATQGEASGVTEGPATTFQTKIYTAEDAAVFNDAARREFAPAAQGEAGLSEPRFAFEVYVGDECLAQGECPTFAEAEREADHYAAQYADDGEVSVEFYQVTKIDRGAADRRLTAEHGGADKWEGAEGWEQLAWELCANECGEDACNELIWEGGPVPEPWGERWLKYEDEAKRLLAMVRKYAPAPVTAEQGGAPLDRGPHFVECEGSEPSLRMLVHKYYEAHFPLEEANYHAMRYLRDVATPPAQPQAAEPAGEVEQLSAMVQTLDQQCAKYEAALRHLAENAFAKKDWQYARAALATPTSPTEPTAP